MYKNPHYLASSRQSSTLIVAKITCPTLVAVFGVCRALHFFTQESNGAEKVEPVADVASQTIA
jgi:hypothetical protein